MMRRSHFLAAAAATAISVALATLGVPGLAAAHPAVAGGADAARRPAQAVSVSSEGVQLTPNQEASLRAATALNPHLTAAQAASAIGLTLPGSAGQAAPAGQTQTSGACGNASLVGYSNGNYGLALFFNASVGPPSFGSVSISTDASDASTDTYDIPPTSFSGYLSDVGTEPTATTANGYAYPFNNWWCYISLTAYW